MQLKCFTISFAPFFLIKKPACNGSGESIQVFKHFSQLPSQFYLFKADEIKVLDSLVVAVVSDTMEVSYLLLFSALFLFY